MAAAVDPSMAAAAGPLQVFLVTRPSTLPPQRLVPALLECWFHFLLVLVIGARIFNYESLKHV
jgi:hypothetical protein